MPCSVANVDSGSKLSFLRMDLDDYLSRLNNDLDSQLSRFDQQFAPDISSTNGDMPGTDSLFCPECGTRNPSSANFCCNCGTSLSDSGGDGPSNCDSEQTGDCETQYGILYTDTVKLAQKYGRPQDDVCAVLQNFCEKAATYNMHWELLDASDYPDYFNFDDFWLEHNELISDYFEKSSIGYGMKTPLFIIGGHDVIPIPMVEDVFGTADDGKIPCDMCYGFTGNFFSDLWDGGDHTITEDYVRNTVSRLPLEDGQLNSTLEDDLEAYFDRCAGYYCEGVAVDKVMMTANASWLPASKTMSEHLPLVHHADDPDMVKHGMYVSPPVSAEDEETTEPVLQTLEETGMLLFNLHGASGHNMPGFYNDRGEAFSLDMLSESTARVFNTVACYGARYHGYGRDESMLLTSFYEDGFLLYAGSLIPVPMTELDVPDGVEVHEGSGSEHLMPIFCMEQFSGVPVGEAMMRAKLEYFNTFRHMERDDFSLATMMMFGLYGNPMLRLQRNEEVLRRAREEHVLPVLPQNKQMPIRMKRTQRVITCKEQASSSLLDQVRSSVDGNLAAIHQTVQQHLYEQLGLEPRWLSHVDSFSIPNGDGTSEEGYSYAYEDMSKAFARKSWVEVDKRGKVKRVFETK